MTVYSVIIGSPPEGSILPSGAFGSRGWCMNPSTPAERLNIAFKLGKSGSTPKSGRMKARYSMSAGLPASGQIRISISGSCAAKLSRQASALPIILSRLTMSSAISPPETQSLSRGDAGKLHHEGTKHTKKLYWELFVLFVSSWFNRRKLKRPERKHAEK